MNRISDRDAAFLAEMGIGPLWRLRAAPADEAVQDAVPADEVTQAPVPAAGLPAEAPAAGRSAAPPAAAPAGSPSEAAPTQFTPITPPADQAWGDVPAYAVQGAPPPPAPQAEPEAPVDVSAMDWDALEAAVAACTRCGACREGRKPVFGTGARKARWLVAAGATTAADEQEGAPLAGEPGKLLDNMLFAVDLSRERDVYVTNLVKCRPASASGGDRAPTAAEAAACRPFLERELALTGASAVLTLGQVAANALVGKALQEPLAGARGSVHDLNGVPLVATLHPGELLRRGADKALAWADLCRARAADARRD